MSTPLHDVEVLSALAETAEGPARDWATVRLALRDPDRLPGLPDNDWDATICLAAAGPGIVPTLREALPALPGPRAAHRVDRLLSVGHTLDDPDAWTAALQALELPDEHRLQLVVARALADLGALDGERLAACTRVPTEAPGVLPGITALVLHFAADHGHDLDAVAAQVAPRLHEPIARDPALIGDTMSWLGVPWIFPLHDDTLEDTARRAAAAAGGELTRLPAARGSARTRARRQMEALLDGVQGPAPALIRALAGDERAPSDILVAIAAWLGAWHPPDDPVEAVVRGAGEDRATLAAARSAVDEAHAPALAEHILDPAWSTCPAAAVAGALVTRASPPPPVLGEALASRSLVDMGSDERLDAATIVAVAREPERLVRLLADPETRPPALAWARFVPTESVLETLLELPVPAEPTARGLYALALADLADPAVEAPLQALAASDESPQVAAAIRRAEALFGRSLSTG